MTQIIDEAIPRPAAPSTTQSHGTILACLVLGFVVLFVLLRISISGVGPFAVELVGSRQAGDSLEITLRITNQGDRTGRANCRVPLADENDVVQAPKNVLTQRIDPGETLTEVVTVDVPAGVRPSGPISC